MGADYQVRIKRRSDDWERLRELMARAGSRGLHSLSERELNELPGYYRKTLSDLSLLRTSGSDPSLQHELNQLCNAAHSLIYARVAQQRKPSALWFVACELPRAVRRRAGYIWAATAISLLFAVIGWIHAGIDDTVPETVLGPQMVGGIRASLKYAEQHSDLGLAAQIPVEDRNAMALLITINNISVSIRAFIFGILAALPTLIILGFNGYMLGVIGFIYFNTTPGVDINLPLYFVSGIFPHGSIELPAIFIAGGAGMLLGLSWVFPGKLPRGQALREAANDAGKLVITCALTLVAAGAIEGFITPLLPPSGLGLETWFWFKIVFGALVFIAWMAWLLMGGRLARSINKS